MESKKRQQIRGRFRIEDHPQSTRRLSGNKYISINQLDMPPTGDQRVLIAGRLFTMLFYLLHPFAKGIGKWPHLFMLYFTHLCPHFLSWGSALSSPGANIRSCHFRPPSVENVTPPAP